MNLSGERLLVCDGAMGTMLHAAGAALDRSLPELNRSDPALVSTIHESYLSAGADIIQTNTFGANRLWLGDHGLAGQVDEINRAGVRLARAAQARSDREVLVAGSVSPAVTAVARRRVGSAERMAVIREQIQALQGVDLLILETFGYLDELVEAVDVASEVADVPVVAQATFADDAHTLGGETPREVATILSALPVAMLGTNCTVGPQRMLTVAEDLVRYASVPVSAQPNAGQPRRTGPRSFEFSIDGGYFARYLRRFADAGVSLVGGCCGTTPAHIGAAVAALRPPAPATPPRVSTTPPRASTTPATKTTPEPPRPVAGTLADRLARKRFVVAAAITPPPGALAADVAQTAAALQARGIGVFTVQPPPSARTHSDALDMALHLQARAGVEAVATLTTWDKTIMTLQADLLGAHALGLRNVIAATGSPPVLGDYPAVDGIWEVDSLGLIALLAGLNAGRDSNGLALAPRTSFCIGARVNPGARDPAAEIARARAKVAAGAQFLVAKPVYELDSLLRVVTALDAEVPVLLSVTPLRSFEEADYLAHEVPGVTIPAAALRAMELPGRGAARAAGAELAADLLRDARKLVGGVILTTAEDDLSVLAPLLAVLG
jgi:methionine synthase / methylenetetrahydrofolate reductase(NADPH)